MTAPSQFRDPLASLFIPAPAPPAVPLRYRSGTLISYEPDSGQNTVEVDGTTFANVPLLPGTYLGVAVIGDTVALLSTIDDRGATTYAIAGLMLTPPNERIPRAARAAGYAKYHKGLTEMSGTLAAGAGYDNIPDTSSFYMFKSSADSAIEIEVCGTFWLTSPVGGAAVSIGVSIDFDSAITVFDLKTSNTAYGNYTPYFGSILVEGIGAGNHSFQPQWAVTGTSTGVIDTGSFHTTTVREIL